MIKTRERPSKKINPIIQRTAGRSQMGEEFLIFVQSSESESPLLWNNPKIVSIDKQSVKIAQRTFFFIEERLYRLFIKREIGIKTPGLYDRGVTGVGPRWVG